MRVTWDVPKQIQNVATGELVNLPAGSPWEMDDEEAVQRIDQADCAPVDKAEYKSKKAAREKRLADEAKAKLAPEPVVPEPIVEAPLADVTDVADHGVRMKK